jgi:hypothetical protein
MPNTCGQAVHSAGTKLGLSHRLLNKSWLVVPQPAHNSPLFPVFRHRFNHWLSTSFFYISLCYSKTFHYVHRPYYKYYEVIY